MQRQLALCKQNQEMLAETEHYALIEGEKSLTPAGGSRFIQRSEAAYRIVSGFLYDAVMVEAFPGILGGDSEIQPDCTVRKPGIPIVLMTLIAAAIAAGVWFGPRGWSELHRRLATAVSIMRCYEIANKAVAVIIAACAQGKQKIRVLLRRFL